MDATRRAELRKALRPNAPTDTLLASDTARTGLAFQVGELLALLDADERVEQALKHCDNFAKDYRYDELTDVGKTVRMQRKRIADILRGSHD